YQTTFKQSAKVISFSGYENPELGIWGHIAEKLGKKDLFAPYYEPLDAPGQSAWVNLLKGEPVLILLDELPIYFEGAEAKQIGNSDLAKITAVALSRLLVAVGNNELSNVCVVMSDLNANWNQGRAYLQQVVQDLN